MTEDALSRIDHYLDRVPRSAARTEEVGPFTLFVGQPHGWQYYGRPRFALDEAITRRDVEGLLERQRELEVPEAIEGLADVTPSLATACQDAGLSVEELPLLIYRSPRKVPIPDGVRIRRADPDDVAVSSSQAVAALAFDYEGTGTAAVGPKQRDELLGTRDEGTDALVSRPYRERSERAVRGRGRVGRGSQWDASTSRRRHRDCRRRHAACDAQARPGGRPDSRPGVRFTKARSISVLPHCRKHRDSSCL